MWDSAVLIIGIELSLRIVHYDFNGGGFESMLIRAVKPVSSQ